MTKWPEKKEFIPQHILDIDTPYNIGWNACHSAFMKVINQKSTCEHDWHWSNNGGFYFCNKCNDWSYLGNQSNTQVTTETSPKPQPSGLVPLPDISIVYQNWLKKTKNGYLLDFFKYLNDNFSTKEREVPTVDILHNIVQEAICDFNINDGELRFIPHEKSKKRTLTQVIADAIHARLKGNEK